MPQRSNEFQHLVALIEAAVNIEDGKVYESLELEDRVTGKRREVDVVIELSRTLHPVMIGVECRGGGDKPRPADVGWVESMCCKHRDLPTKSNLILVAKAGFTKQAEEKARYYGVECLSLEAAEKVDWEAKVKSLDSIEMRYVVEPFITRNDFVLAEEVRDEFKAQAEEVSSVLIRPDGSTIDANDLSQHWLSSVKARVFDEQPYIDVGTTFELEVPLKEGVRVVCKSGATYPVTAVRLEGRYHKLKETVDLQQTTFRDVAVAHAATEKFGHEIKTVLTERRGEQVRWASSVRPGNRTTEKKSSE